MTPPPPTTRLSLLFFTTTISVWFKTFYAMLWLVITHSANVLLFPERVKAKPRLLLFKAESVQVKMETGWKSSLEFCVSAPDFAASLLARRSRLWMNDGFVTASLRPQMVREVERRSNKCRAGEMWGRPQDLLSACEAGRRPSSLHEQPVLFIRRPAAAESIQLLQVEFDATSLLAVDESAAAPQYLRENNKRGRGG